LQWKAIQEEQLWIMKEEQVMASALRAMRDANALRASDGAWRFD
jgi:hypothetical protein